MKIIGINGSARDDGNTSILLKELLKGASEAGTEVYYHYLNSFKMRCCQSCYKCFELGECAQHDDMWTLCKDIKEADVIVLGSPVYMGQMTGQAKLFTDRLMPLFNADFTSRIQGKKMVLIFTQGQPGVDFYKDYFNQTRHLFEFLGFDVKDILAAGGTREKTDILKQQAVLNKARDMGKKLVNNK